MFLAFYYIIIIIFHYADQVRNSYFIGLDGSLRLVLANGMEVSLHTEPHLLAGTVNPTVSKRNVTLAIDNGLNLVEWRQRKEQARGQVTVYGRRLRVSEVLEHQCTAVAWRLSHRTLLHQIKYLITITCSVVFLSSMYIAAPPLLTVAEVTKTTLCFSLCAMADVFKKTTANFYSLYNGTSRYEHNPFQD